jgi:predicted secreted hydrolase
VNKRMGLASMAAAAVVCASTLAAQAEYPPAVTSYRISLPKDHGSHPQFRTEWWYVTGWLQDSAGAPLGFQVTFFRSRPGLDESNPSRFAAKQVLFAHAAVSDPKRGVLLRDEKVARAGFGLAEASASTLDVHIDDWSFRGSDGAYKASIAAGDFSMQLEFSETQAPLLQGRDGFSQKGPDARYSSHYYSLPQLRTTGRIVVRGRALSVSGNAWLDHEWSTDYMDEAAQGWDWIGLNLADGGALMSFRMRDRNGKEHWSAATWRRGPGEQFSREVFEPGDVEWSALRSWRSPRTQIRYPVAWRLQIGARTIRLEPLMDDQENDARGSSGTVYWEGAVQAFDEADKPIGRGYLELTGYGEKMNL